MTVCLEMILRYFEAIHQPAQPSASTSSLGILGVANIDLAWQASAWLASRAKRGLRQTATATDTAAGEGTSGASGVDLGHDHDKDDSNNDTITLMIDNKKRDEHSIG